MENILLFYTLSVHIGLVSNRSHYYSM